MKIDQAGVREYVAKGLDIVEQVVRKCPTAALEWDANKKELKIKPDECVRCMHCINRMPKALHIGSQRGATLLIGGKAPVVKGAMIGWVLVPFMKMEPPYTELKELIDKMTDWWADNAKSRERIGELIERVGLPNFLKGYRPQTRAADDSCTEGQSLYLLERQGGSQTWLKQILVRPIIRNFFRR